VIVNEVSKSQSLPRLLLFWITHRYELQYITSLLVLIADFAEIILVIFKKQSYTQHVQALFCFKRNKE